MANTDIHLRYSTSIPKLYQVYDGSLEVGPSNELAMYCGLDSEVGIPEPITSSSHVASVHFHTDYSVAGSSSTGVSGFLITWSQVQGSFNSAAKKFLI